jgi:hypothetical protein
MSDALKRQQRMQLFLNDNYFSLCELADVCKVTQKHLLDLESNQCIPRYTYEKRETCIYTCAGIEGALTEQLELVTTRYYHKSIAVWVLDADTRLKTQPMCDVAVDIKDEFCTKLLSALGGKKTPGSQSLDQAWGYLMDGTWGKCLKDISVAGLAKKELARLTIAQIMALDKLSVDDDKKLTLAHAVRSYISASLDFDVYGMRDQLAREAIDAYDLDISLQYV